MSKILVVDDDRATRHILRKVLSNDGFETSVAKDGVAALHALRARRYDLLLLDVTIVAFTWRSDRLGHYTWEFDLLSSLAMSMLLLALLRHLPRTVLWIVTLAMLVFVWQAFYWNLTLVQNLKFL